MDPARKRKIRLILALSAAVLLAVALVYTSFSAATEAKKPSDLPAGGSTSSSLELTGKVVPGTITHEGEQLNFRISDRDDVTKSVPVTYTGTVPDPFRDGREVV